MRRRKRDENTVLINTKENKEPEQTSIVGTFRHVRLRHAKELLSVEPQKFVYSGSVSVFYYLLHKKVFKKREDLILNTVFFFHFAHLDFALGEYAVVDHIRFQ